MKAGVAIFVTDRSIGILELAREAEARGFHSLWLPEHSHIPTARISPWPGGAELPERYKRTLDPFVALAAAAAVTSRIQLGFGILLLVERDPIVTAKAIASLDFLSGGRVLLGVGGGWNKEEMANHGTDPRTRMALLADRVAAMRAIWTADEASHSGPLVSFEPLWSWPKPRQAPLPVYLGGNHPNQLRRAVEWADGWMPNEGRSDVLAQIAEFRGLCEEAGREPLPVRVYGARPDAGELARYREAAVEEVIFWLPSEDRESALAKLDQLTGFCQAEDLLA